MTLLDWLAARDPASEPALSHRIRELAEGCEDAPANTPDQCIAAAEHALARLLAGDQTSRQCALDLLAIDALVTYSFEAAARSPERIPALAHDAMVRLARVSPPRPQSPA